MLMNRSLLPEWGQRKRRSFANIPMARPMTFLIYIAAIGCVSFG